MDKREEFLKRIQATFKIEAEEGIQTIASNVIEMEKNPPESQMKELVEATFRESHSLKGAARAVNNTVIESVCQALESVFSSLKSNQLTFYKQLFDLFHLAIDLLKDILKLSPEEIGQEIKERCDEVVSLLLNTGSAEAQKTEIKEPVLAEKPKTEEPIPEDKPDIKEISPAETVKNVIIPPKIEAEKIKKTGVSRELNVAEEKTIRVSVEKLDDLLFQSTELLSIKLNMSQDIKDINRIIQNLQGWNDWATKIHPLVENLSDKENFGNKQGTILPKKQELAQIVGFCEWTGSNLKKLEEELQKLKKSATQNSYESNLKIDNFTDEVKRIISVPFSTLLYVFPKACRDLSKDLGKEAELIISGDDVEIDRRILEIFRNPLMHILRNSIDHGIEKPEIRKINNKPVKGKMHFSISRLENNKVEITINDDGAGIDLEKLKEKYIEQENCTEKEAQEITDTKLIDYIFQSGITTSEMITDLSGRGLGLAIVREKTEELGGELTVTSKKGEGTEFKIQLPISMVTFRGVHIRCGNQDFIVPTLKISKVLRQKKTEIRTVEGKTGITYQEKFLPFFYLADVLELPVGGNGMEYIPSLVVGPDENRIAIAVDEILDEEEVLVKRFNIHLANVQNISGATVLGSGKVVPVLNVDDMVRFVVSKGQGISRGTAIETEKEKKSILVVEDSITSRMLLKNILETAGYEVVIAVDGIDGYTKLKEGEFQLVVSDIDMPRLNGFDLTAKIRSDKMVSEMPVVLVTSLSKPEDRERGMEVGANAYIIKSSFDQSNLLEVIERLI